MSNTPNKPRYPTYTRKTFPVHLHVGMTLFILRFTNERRNNPEFDEVTVLVKHIPTDLTFCLIEVKGNPNFDLTVNEQLTKVSPEGKIISMKFPQRRLIVGYAGQDVLHAQVVVPRIPEDPVVTLYITTLKGRVVASTRPFTQWNNSRQQ